MQLGQCRLSEYAFLPATLLLRSRPGSRLITGTLLEKDKQAQQDTDLDQGHTPTVTEPGSELADA